MSRLAAAPASKSQASKFRTRRVVSRRLKRQAGSPAIHPLVQMQQTYGNRAVGRFIQAQLKVSQPGDKYEQEADRVAEQVVNSPGAGPSHSTTISGAPQRSSVQRMPEMEEGNKELKKPDEIAVPAISRMPEEEKDKELHKKPVEGKADEEEMTPNLQTKPAAQASPSVNPSVANNINRMQGGGTRLPKPVRAYFEPRMGADFSQVRVYADAHAADTAKSINAKAFTVGRNIAFGAGEYAPDSTSGRKLLAHELTHVMQQGAGLAKPQIQRMTNTSQLPTGLSCPIGHDSPGVSELDIVFRVNSDNLSASDQAAIDNFVNNWHATGANEDVRLDGYASPEGPDSLNWTLSCNRAIAVKNSLMAPLGGGPGIPGPHIEIFAHGETTEFAVANSPNRRVSIHLRGNPPAPIPPESVQTRVIPCAAVPIEIIRRGACGAGTDFTYNDFPPLTGTSTTQQAAVWEADHLTFDYNLRNRMRAELGTLAGTEGLRMVTHFSEGTGTKLTHDSFSTLGTDALVSGAFSSLHAGVIREIELQLANMDAAGVVDCNAISLSPAGVPAVSFGFSDSFELKAIIGGTQGLRIQIAHFSVNPGMRSYGVQLQYLICDDFGVDTADLYSPALIAFWVLQHRRSGYLPFINELDLPKTEVGHY